MGEDDDSIVGFGLTRRLGEIDCGIEDLFFGFLSIEVGGIEVVCESACFFGCGGGEEFDGFCGVPHSAGCVEAGGEPETDRFGVYFGFVIEAGCFDECVEAGEGSVSHHFEAEARDGSIFVDEGNDVGDGSERSECEEVGE